MKKGILISIGGFLVFILLYLSYLFGLNQNQKTCDIGDLDIQHIDNSETVSNFEYVVNSNDIVKIYVYEYKKDPNSANYIFVSESELKNVTQEQIDSINALLTNVNGKQAVSGSLYGPVNAAKINIETSTFEMEILLGYNSSFITIRINENGITRVFTIKEGLTNEIEQLLLKI